MISFHGKQEIKDNLLLQLQLHAQHDEIVKGVYWELGKGCAVGCTIHSSDHTLYESMYGIPRVLARIEDVIFERLSNRLAKEFPINFIKNIPVGVNLSNVWKHFMIWLLEDEKYGAINFYITEQLKSIIVNTIGIYKKSLTEIVDECVLIENKNALKKTVYDVYDNDYSIVAEVKCAVNAIMYMAQAEDIADLVAYAAEYSAEYCAEFVPDDVEDAALAQSKYLLKILSETN